MYRNHLELLLRISKFLFMTTKRLTQQKGCKIKRIVVYPNKSYI